MVTPSCANCRHSSPIPADPLRVICGREPSPSLRGVWPRVFHADRCGYWIAALLALVAACGPSVRDRCLAAGGRWVPTDCRTEERRSCLDVPVGDGETAVPLCTTLFDTVCDHTCLDAPPEAP